MSEKNEMENETEEVPVVETPEEIEEAQPEEDIPDSVKRLGLKVMNGGQFLEHMKNVSHLVEEVEIKASQDGLRIMMMDPSHVAMVDAHFKPSYFDSYEGQIEFGLDKRVLNMSVTKDPLDIEYDPDKVRLVLTQKGDRMRAHIIETEYEVPEPKINFDAEIRVIPKRLRTLFGDLAKFGCDFVVFKATETELSISGESDYGARSLTILKGDDDCLELKVDNEAEATYTLSYIQDIVKASTSIGEAITISLSTDMPIQVATEIPSLDVKFWCAPCIGV